MRRLLVGVWLAVAGLGGGLPLYADRYDEQIPEKPQRYVTDRAGVFGPGQAEALNASLEQFEKDTSDQILVWAADRIPEGFTLEDFTVRAAQKWGAGQKKEDNGAILFVFTGDRKVRIEVGYGLEGPLPDAIAKQIIDGEIVPHFRDGDYAGGITAGVNAMMAAVRGEYKGTGTTVDERRRGGASGSMGNLGCLFISLLVFFFIIVPALTRNRKGFRTHGGRGWWTGGGGWGGGGGGWGGGGGGGFSGGGGSFGGGGASGSW